MRAPFRLICLTSAVALLAIATASPAAAIDYLGERCWRRDPDGILARIGISQVGDGHFLLTGTADSSGPGQTTPLHGSAELLDGRIFMTLHFAGEDDGRIWSGTGRAILDAVTLDGTIEVLEVFHLKDDPSPFSAIAAHEPAAPFTLVPCPGGR